MNHKIKLLFLLVVFAAGCGKSVDSQLLDAVRRDDTIEVEELLVRGANADCRDRRGVTALILAYECGHLQVFKMLLEHHANPDIVLSDGRSAMHLSATNANSDWLRHAIENGGSVDLTEKGASYNPEMTPLFYAVGEGRIENIRLLLDNGASINFRRDLDRRFPLMHAAAVMRYDAAYELLLRGADYELECHPGNQTLAKWLRVLNGDEWVTSDQREHFHKVRHFLIERGIELGPFNKKADRDCIAD